MAQSTTRPEGSSKSHGNVTRCRRCSKLIVWPGLCYTCATGQPRRFFRPEELAASDAEPTPIGSAASA